MSDTSMAPPAIIATPIQFAGPSFSPRNATPKSATSTTLSCRSAPPVPHLRSGGPKVAEPRRSGAKSRQDEEEIGSAADPAELLPFAGDEDNAGERDNDDDHPDQGGKIGIDALDADLGEDRRQRGEGRRAERPGLPTREQCCHFVHPHVAWSLAVFEPPLPLRRRVGSGLGSPLDPPHHHPTKDCPGRPRHTSRQARRLANERRDRCGSARRQP